MNLLKNSNEEFVVEYGMQLIKNGLPLNTLDAVQMNIYNGFCIMTKIILLKIEEKYGILTM